MSSPPIVHPLIQVGARADKAAAVWRCAGVSSATPHMHTALHPHLHLHAQRVSAGCACDLSMIFVFPDQFLRSCLMGFFLAFSCEPWALSTRLAITSSRFSASFESSADRMATPLGFQGFGYLGNMRRQRRRNQQPACDARGVPEQIAAPSNNSPLHQPDGAWSKLALVSVIFGEGDGYCRRFL